MSNKAFLQGLQGRGNYIYLLIGLLLLLFLGPAITHWLPEVSRFITQLSFLSVMIIGVWSLNNNRTWFIICIVLVCISLSLSCINFFIESKLLFLLALLNTLLFCLLSILIAMRHILFSGSITTNKIVGSLCIYLLLGIVWAILYVFVDVLEPGSLKGLTLSANYAATWDYIYYSFVTLTTLGYGDISPVNQYARTLAYLEAISGQIYLAVLVASLVGAHLSDQQRKQE